MRRFPRPKRHRRPRPFLPNSGVPEEFETSVDPTPELEDWMIGAPGGK